MDLATLKDVYQQWLRSLEKQGLFMQHSYSLSTAPEALVMATILLGAQLDSEYRTRAIGRQPKGNRPFARMQYLVAVSADDDPNQAEQALLSLLVEAERHPDIRLLPDPVEASWWLAKGVSPRPGFIIEVRVTKPATDSEAPVVKEHAVDLSKLRG